MKYNYIVILLLAYLGIFGCESETDTVEASDTMTMAGTEAGAEAGAEAGTMENISCGADGPSIEPSEVPNGIVGVEYYVDFNALGGSQDEVSWIINLIPDGLQFDEATGELSGTPTTAGEYELELQANISSSGPCSVHPGFASYTLVIAEAE